MQAVVLAAGLGSRLSAASRGRPKCLVEVGGATLLEHHLRALRAVGIHEVLFVLGHKAIDIQLALRCETGCSFVINEDYATTNSLYSLRLAAPHLNQHTLVINADVLAHPTIYDLVVEQDGTALAYDPSSGKAPEEMAVRVEQGLVTGMAKTLPVDQTHGENLGLLRVAASDLEAFFAAADAVLEEGTMAWAPAAMDRFCRHHPVHAVDVGELPWVEIDFPQDLEHARANTWPAIAGPTYAAGTP